MLDSEDTKINKIIPLRSSQIHGRIRHDDKGLEFLLRDIGDGADMYSWHAMRALRRGHHL